jgi:VIT1/CCC1 family predicted Fe2+/Mn2+ transporter
VRPIQAALTSASTFAVGAALPLALAYLGPSPSLLALVAGGSLACLAVMGALAAHAGDAGVWVGAARCSLWGALAMAATTAAGRLFGAGM